MKLNSENQSIPVQEIEVVPASIVTTGSFAHEQKNQFFQKSVDAIHKSVEANKINALADKKAIDTYEYSSKEAIDALRETVAFLDEELKREDLTPDDRSVLLKERSDVVKMINERAESAEQIVAHRQSQKQPWISTILPIICIIFNCILIVENRRFI